MAGHTAEQFRREAMKARGKFTPADDWPGIVWMLGNIAYWVDRTGNWAVTEDALLNIAGAIIRHIDSRQSGNGVAAVCMEREHQHVRWGDQSGHPDAVWLDILTEEVGEVAQARLHDKFGGEHAGTEIVELVQVAAVALAWVEARA